MARGGEGSYRDVAEQLNMAEPNQTRVHESVCQMINDAEQRLAVAVRIFWCLPCALSVVLHKSGLQRGHCVGRDPESESCGPFLEFCPHMIVSLTGVKEVQDARGVSLIQIAP